LGVLHGSSVSARLGLGVVGVGLAAACGARSQLLAPDIEDAGDVVVIDARDVMIEEDVVEEDVLPPIDQFNDSPIPTDCPDAGSTLVYVITAQNELFSFYPPTLAFTKIGTISCPGSNGATPYSMAVNRTGTAYSVFTDGTLWQISTANAACKPTSYVPAVNGTPFYNFGMGYAGNNTTESLYVADAAFNANSLGLATIDTKTFTRSFIADFNPELPRCELTGTGDGRLFAFCLHTSGSGSLIAEVDPSTAKVIAENNLTIADSSDAFAYAFWGGFFWIFWGPSSTTVTKYDPLTLSETTVATMSSTIVGAGVSTCAPQ
jgi:hypothetical protein